MRNVILVTKLEGSSMVKRVCFILIDKIVAIECPRGDTFRMYLDNDVWNIPSSEYERIMHSWAPYYKELKEYKNYIENK